MQDIHAIVLAAGRGKRMQSKSLPKVLFKIGGQPMLSYVFKSLAASGIESPIVVIGFMGKKIVAAFPSQRYVWERRQLGTGHAVTKARPLLEGQSGCTLIINGDQPFFRPSTLKRLSEAVTKQGAAVAVLTGLMESEEFDAFGRVVTDAAGHILRIVELKDASETEKKIRLMNLGGYAVDNAWLWPALRKLKKSPVSGEYYITDIVSLAVAKGKKVIAIPIEDKGEAIGINTLAHLAEAERLFQQP